MDKTTTVSQDASTTALLQQLVTELSGLRSEVATLSNRVAASESAIATMALTVSAHAQHHGAGGPEASSDGGSDGCVGAGVNWAEVSAGRPSKPGSKHGSTHASPPPETQTFQVAKEVQQREVSVRERSTNGEGWAELRVKPQPRSDSGKSQKQTTKPVVTRQGGPQETLLRQQLSQQKVSEPQPKVQQQQHAQQAPRRGRKGSSGGEETREERAARQAMEERESNAPRVVAEVVMTSNKPDVAKPGQSQQDLATSKWMQQQVKAESARLAGLGAKAAILTVKNCVVVRDGGKTVNRIEVATNLDFSGVEQLLVSDPVAVPMKKGFSYVNVVLFTKAKSVPLLIPYVFPSSSGSSNRLCDWCFINSKNEIVQHHIDGFQDV